MIEIKRVSIALVILALLSVTETPLLAVQKDGPEKKKEIPQGTPVLWREPTNIASRDLFRGEGEQPDLKKITFVREDKSGTSKKYRVTDASGREWVAKVGSEAQSETAAARLLWAAGYNTEIVHLVPSVEIVGKGTFPNVRFELRPKTVKRHGQWLWMDNPFVGKRELQGLKVLMALINNWDLKDDNNVIMSGRTPGVLDYGISDLGASFGKTGSGALWRLKRSRNNPQDYVKSKFINGVKGKNVDFTFAGVNAKMLEEVTIEDARWIGKLLGRLSDKQISDAFRAANYTPDEIRILTQAVRGRINDLVRLPGSSVASR